PGIGNLIAGPASLGRPGLTRSGIGHHFIFDIVIVVEIEAAAGIVGLVGMRDEPGVQDAAFSGGKVVNEDADMVEAALRMVGGLVPRIGLAGRIERDIGAVGADMGRDAIVLGRALPADMPAED